RRTASAQVLAPQCPGEVRLRTYHTPLRSKRITAIRYHCVVKVTPEGKVETVLKAERPWSPTGVAVFGEDVYVLEYTNSLKGRDEGEGWQPRVRKLSRDGKVTALATVARDEQKPNP